MTSVVVVVTVVSELRLAKYCENASRLIRTNDRCDRSRQGDSRGELYLISHYCCPKMCDFSYSSGLRDTNAQVKVTLISYWDTRISIVRDEENRPVSAVHVVLVQGATSVRSSSVNCTSGGHTMSILGSCRLVEGLYRCIGIHHRLHQLGYCWQYRFGLYTYDQLCHHDMSMQRY